LGPSIPALRLQAEQQGSARLYSAYLGGSDYDCGGGIAMDIASDLALGWDGGTFHSPAFWLP